MTTWQDKVLSSTPIPFLKEGVSSPYWLISSWEKTCRNNIPELQRSYVHVYVQLELLKMRGYFQRFTADCRIRALRDMKQDQSLEDTCRNYCSHVEKKGVMKEGGNCKFRERKQEVESK